MADLVTLTLNPALDVTVASPTVVPSRKLRCGQPMFEAGGGGINIAKVAHVLGVEAAAVYPYGGDSGAQMSALLAEHPVVEHPIRIAGTTRESFTALETGGDNEFRFVLPGPTLTAAELGQCLDTLAAAVVGARYVALSGSLPPGVPTSIVADVAAIARDAGARLVLDSSGDALREAGGGIFLVKPSVGELRDWVGRELSGDDEIADAARTIIADGTVEVAVVSLGPGGAMLVSADETVRVPAINAPVRSTVGAGDSMVAGLITGFLQERTLSDTLALGIACATAALLTPGSEVCKREDIDRFYKELAV
ncbi:1-phosphofructokinase family hexose kinase [Tomitella biformata]|uniref:1-phosphofructokinase family hexose kinase n=1 Tax=Tomitella biformata TaxID=630403 RepID=UPI0004661F80|nr:1-phosphofructokinase family hexose kinase [Tomitella biformata]